MSNKPSEQDEAQQSNVLGAVSTTDFITGELVWTQPEHADKEALLPTTIAALGFLYQNPSHDWVQVFTIDYAGTNYQFGYCHKENKEELQKALTEVTSVPDEKMPEDKDDFPIHGATVVIHVVDVENPKDLPEEINDETTSSMSSTLSGSADRVEYGTALKVTRKQYNQPAAQEAVALLEDELNRRSNKLNLDSSSSS